MSDAQQQQFGVMPMSAMGLLQQAKIMTMDYGQAIQNSWLEQQKETAALYGGLSLDGSNSGEPGLVELYMSMAYEAADEQAHASRIQAYTSFGKAGVSAGQAGFTYKAGANSGLKEEQEKLPGLKKSFEQEGSLQAASEDALKESNAKAHTNRFNIDENSPEGQARKDILENNNFQKYNNLSEEQQKTVKASFDSTEKEQINNNLDKRGKELSKEIEQDNARVQNETNFVRVVGEAAGGLADGIGKMFESQATAAATKLQADSQIMKDVASQAQQTEESAKRQATQAQEGALQVAGWVITQVQA